MGESTDDRLSDVIAAAEGNQKITTAVVLPWLA